MQPGCKSFWHFFAQLLISLICRYNPISAEVFDGQVYSVFYNHPVPAPGAPQEVRLTLQKLSLLFMVLAIGSLMDISLPAYNKDAERYHQLARAALFQTSIFDAPSLHAIQTLVSALDGRTFILIN
jgi:hypothetical protein